MARERDCAVEALYFDVPVEIRGERNESRHRRVLVDVMRRMAHELEAPSFKEGFDRIVTIGADGETRSDQTAPQGFEP